jgi:hypothetical protein
MRLTPDIGGLSLCCSIVVSVTANISTIRNGNHDKFIFLETMVGYNPLA